MSGKHARSVKWEKGTIVMVGESSLSIFERANVHVMEGEKGYLSSHIHQHLMEEHRDCTDVRGAFGSRLVNRHKTSFSRQIEEVILQRNFKGKLLNNKLNLIGCLTGGDGWVTGGGWVVFFVEAEDQQGLIKNFAQLGSDPEHKKWDVRRKARKISCSII